MMAASVVAFTVYATGGGPGRGLIPTIGILVPGCGGEAYVMCGWRVALGMRIVSSGTGGIATEAVIGVAKGTVTFRSIV